MPELFGRTPILTDAADISGGNIVEIIEKAMPIHERNRAQIQYLWDYYRGKQPILQRVKKVRPEICNRIVENRANEIVSFKVGYLCGEPIQYIAKNSNEAVSTGISCLNAMMESIDKDAQDRDLVEWQSICGTAYRRVLPKKVVDGCPPFEMYTLDPRQTFNVYSAGVEHEKLLGVTYYDDSENVRHIFAYSRSQKYEITDKKVTKTEPHPFGCVPIFEYPANNARLGAFEIVISLLDEINSIASNRMDGIEQFVQAFIKFINCEITAKDFVELLEKGAIMVKSPPGVSADVDIVASQLDQTQTQVVKDDAYSSVLTICGMPNRNGGSSTSDTGAAVIYRDGWSAAETRAKDSENSFKRSERQVLALVLKACREVEGAPKEVAELSLKDITLKFTRRNYENIQTKAQVLDLLLKNGKVHPLVAYQMCGALPDPESACRMGLEWFDKQQKEEIKRALEQVKTSQNQVNTD